MFTFANPFLLWAFPVLILPWIFRRRQEERIQKIEFPLIRFLIESEEKDLINPRLQELLLLILRTILLLFLLLALAGPKWNADDSFSRRLFSFLPVGASVQSSVVVVDGSYSMGYGQGETSWWNRTFRAVEQVNRELTGFNTSWLWWDQDSFTANNIKPLQISSYSEIIEKMETLPALPGTSISDLLTALSAQFKEQERIILITDGQRKIWEPLLHSDTSNQTSIPLLVITVGDNNAQNAWIETGGITPPPWGIAISESVTGNVKSQNVNQNASLSVYERESGKSIFNQLINFSAGSDVISNVPFQFSLNLHDLLNNGQTSNQNTITLMMELDTQDVLMIDNREEITLPVTHDMQIGIAYQTAMPPVELRFITSAFLDRVNMVPLTPPGILYQQDIHLTVLANHFVTDWSPADTMNTLDYLKNGGNALIFTDATGGSAWNNLLEEIGWAWDNNATGSEFRNVSVAAGEGLADALQAWNPNMWDVWKPAAHGKMSFGSLNSPNTKPIITYQSGELEFHLIAETQLGKGKVWLVNANIKNNGNAVWSPILPSILWESAKEAAQNPVNVDDQMPQPRWESDLTVLTEEDKSKLRETYNIQFTEPEDAAKELSAVYGGMDLRYLLILLTIFTALLESWLSNRLASL